MMRIANRQLNRSTRDTLTDHLARRLGRQLDIDIELNYSPDVVLLTHRGVFYGHEGARQVESSLPARLRYRRQLVSGGVAFLEWDGYDGAETFVVREGRIVVQTLRFREES
jgi:hypothetical protein